MLNRIRRPDQNTLRLLLIIIILLTAIIGAVLGVHFLGSTVYDVEGLSLRMSIEPARYGQTVIDLSPFGSITAPTHAAPLELHIKLHYIGTDLAARILGPSEDGIAFLSNLRELLPQLFYKFALKQVAVAWAGAFILVLALWRPRLKYAVLSALTASLIFAFTLGYGATTYNLQAFREPQYTGVISLATRIIPEPDKLLNRLSEVENQTRLLVVNIRQLFTSVNGLTILGNPEQEDDVVKVLLVSDLQSNPVGVEFIQALARNFRVHLVIDAGDLTDLGSPLETNMATGLAEIDLPYIFAPGNHDTPDTIEFMRNLKNTVIVNGKITRAAGLNILGMPEPLSQGPEVTAETTQWNKLLDEQAELLLQAASPEQPVDLVVVHHPRVARQLAGTYPLIVTGHTHQQSIHFSNNSIIINPGSSGAAGARGLYTDQVVPYSAVILYVKPGKGPTAADTIKYDPLSDRFYIERKLLKKDPQPNPRLEKPLADI